MCAAPHPHHAQQQLGLAALAEGLAESHGAVLGCALACHPPPAAHPLSLARRLPELHSATRAGDSGHRQPRNARSQDGVQLARHVPRARGCCFSSLETPKPPPLLAAKPPSGHCSTHAWNPDLESSEEFRMLNFDMNYLRDRGVRRYGPNFPS